LPGLLARPGWHLDADLAEALREPLLRLCAHYLSEAGREGRSFDPVARFHLGNGALVERLNWLGDTSPKGLRQSAGIMVNYRYEAASIERNHERFAATQEVTLSSAVERLTKPARRRRDRSPLSALLGERGPEKPAA
jgi:malonyl-CoA decarboxylase